MGFRFRTSIKIAPSVRINLSKKGLSSVSVGKRGATVNVGKKGTRGTVGIPGSGLSYSTYKAHNKYTPISQRSTQQAPTQNNNPASTRLPTPLAQDINATQKPVSMLLGIGIFLFPIIFAWFTLRQGYSTVSRAISMVWMIIYVFALP